MIEPENNKADDFDVLLDKALASYGEPVAGLEERVLAQVRSARPSRRTWWVAGSVAAAIAVAALLLPLYRPSLHRSAERSSIKAPSEAGLRSVPPSRPAASQEPLGQSSASETPAKALPVRHRRLRLQQVAEQNPGNRVPFPLIVPEDAQERALRVALTRPGFLAALDEASRAAAKSLEEEETQDNKANDPQVDNTQIDLERK